MNLIKITSSQIAVSEIVAHLFQEYQEAGLPLSRPIITRAVKNWVKNSKIKIIHN